MPRKKGYKKSRIKKEAVHYPEYMTINRADKFKNFEGFDDDKSAAAYAKETGGQVYTQVDAGKTVAYEKDFHFVNRTGYYIVVRN